jgi:hypothetical protein
MTDEAKKEDESTELPHTIKLKFPFDPGDGMRKEIVFKRFPRAIMSLPVMARDLTHGHYLSALCSMTDEAELVFKQMCHGDYRKMIDFAANFF